MKYIPFLAVVLLAGNAFAADYSATFKPYIEQEAALKEEYARVLKLSEPLRKTTTSYNISYVSDNTAAQKMLSQRF